MKLLERSIADSKAREERATKGRWSMKDYAGEGIESGLRSLSAGVLIAHIYENNREDNATFITHARTWEPKWREMVEVAVKALRQFEYQNAEYDDDIMTDGSVAREAITELERLAKEGLDK